MDGSCTGNQKGEGYGTAKTGLVDALAAFAVHVGFPDRRAALAADLERAGVTASDVETLGRHCEATVAGGEAAAARVLVSLLTDPAKRAARLDDLAAVRAARARLEAPAGDAERLNGVERVRDFERQWSEYVAARRAAGQPLAGPRAPHRWEASHG